MTSALSVDATFGTGRTIGRYFGVVSAVPSLVLSAWVLFLLATGAARTEPSIGAAVERIASLDLGEVLLLLGVALVIALVFHPLQFALVQLLEGYWGTSRIGKRLRVARCLRHARRMQVARGSARRAEKRLPAPAERVAAVRAVSTEPGDTVSVLTDLINAEASRTVLTRYPVRDPEVMPTRLGNVLRRHESLAGASFGLPILGSATQLGLVARAEHVAYVNDQRSALDLAVRMCAVGLIGTAAAVLLIWPHGLWLLLALPPFAVAWGSYRGALLAAEHYGYSLQALVQLNRFRLYEELHLPPPPDLDAERKQNATLADVEALAVDPEAALPYVRYEHPGSPAPAAKLETDR